MAKGCPYDEVPRYAFDVLSYQSDWALGHTPVTTGRAPWLPARFLQGIRWAGQCMDRAEADAQKRIAEKFKAKQTRARVVGRGR